MEVRNRCKNHRRLTLDRLTAGVFVCALALACGDGSTPQPQETAHMEQSIRGGIVNESAEHVVHYSIAGGGRCTGVLIARNAILTAAHCLPDYYSSLGWSSPVVGSVEVRRKLGTSHWECLSNSTGGTTTGTSSGAACSQWGMADVYWHRDADTRNADDAGADIALLVKSYGEWLDHDLAHVALYLSSMKSEREQLMYGMGASAFDGTGSGELRAGIFYVSWYGSAHYIYKANDTFQVCSGDSGAPIGPWLVENNTIRYAVAGIHSSSDKKGERECASRGLTQRGVRTNAKLSWIEGILGRTCRRETVEGRSLANCW